MNKQQADIILQVLDAATDGNWLNVVNALVNERGYSPSEVVSAWRALEDIAGSSGMAPDVEDFEL